MERIRARSAAERAWFAAGWLALAACSSSAITTVDVTASKTTLQPGEAATLDAVILGTGSFSSGVTWSIDGGGPGLTTSGSTATYTAPLTGAPASVSIRATSTQDASKSGAATITISAAPGPVTVAINPTATRLYALQTIGLNGTVSGPSGTDPGVTWTILSGGGSLSASAGTDVQYTAPQANAGEVTVVIRASPVADPTQHTDLTLHVDHGWPAKLQSGDGEDVARGVVVDANSLAVFVVGETAGHFDVPAQGNGDGFVARFDTYGNLSWVHQFGTGGTESITGVVADTAGNVYVGGQTNGRFSDSVAPPGGNIGFIVAYDKDGNFKWKKEMGPVMGPVGPESDCGVTGLAMDQNQRVYAAGHCVQQLGFVQSCDASGCDGAGSRLTMVMPTTVPSLPAPIFLAVAVDAYGNYDLAGTVPASGAGSTAFVTQVIPANCSAGSACTPAWAHTFTADDPADSVELVAVATDGSNVYAGGTTTGTVNGQSSLGGAKDAFLVAYDRVGTATPLWTKQFGTADADRISGLTYDVLFMHQLYATGTIDSGSGNEEAFLSFYTTAGSSPTAQVTFEGSGTNQGGGVALADGHGHLVLGFTTTSNFDGTSGPHLHVGVRKTDAFGNPLPL